MSLRSKLAKLVVFPSCHVKLTLAASQTMIIVKGKEHLSSLLKTVSPVISNQVSEDICHHGAIKNTGGGTNPL
jgi:hypothetical protein